MLMNVVLPAPFVPMRPTTESASIAALTPPAAVTAPKRFSKPRASRITPISGGLPAIEQRPDAFRQEHDYQQERRPEEQLPRIRRQVEADRMQHTEDERAEEGRHYASRSGQDGDEDEF